MVIRVIGLMTLSPSAKHQRKKLACRLGKRNETGSELIDAAPSMRASMSSFCFSDGVIHYPEGRGRQVTGNTALPLNDKGGEQLNRIAEFAAAFGAVHINAQ